MSKDSHKLLDAVVKKLHTNPSCLEIQVDFPLNQQAVDKLADAIAEHKNLRSITIHNATLNDEGMGALLDAFLENPHLRYVSLSNNKLTDMSLPALEMVLSHSREMISFEVDGNKISPTSATYLATLCYDLPNLVHADIPNISQASEDTLNQIIVRRKKEALDTIKKMASPSTQYSTHTLETFKNILPLIEHQLAHHYDAQADEISDLFAKCNMNLLEQGLCIVPKKTVVDFSVNYSTTSLLPYLRKRPRNDDASPLYKAARNGHMDLVQELVHAHGERLELEDYTYRPYASAKSVLDLAAEHKQLDHIFTPENFLCNPRDMRELWNRVPNAEKTQLDGKDGRPDYQQILEEVNKNSPQALRVASSNIQR